MADTTRWSDAPRTNEIRSKRFCNDRAFNGVTTADHEILQRYGCWRQPPRRSLSESAQKAFARFRFRDQARLAVGSGVCGRQREIKNAFPIRFFSPDSRHLESSVAQEWADPRKRVREFSTKMLHVLGN